MLARLIEGANLLFATKKVNFIFDRNDQPRDPAFEPLIANFFFSQNEIRKKIIKIVAQNNLIRAPQHLIIQNPFEIIQFRPECLTERKYYKTGLTG